MALKGIGSDVFGRVDLLDQKLEAFAGFVCVGFPDQKQKVLALFVSNFRTKKQSVLVQSV